jgi:murein DD-endopeptidase MepM/ murein hydrolase activator NlpD
LRGVAGKAKRGRYAVGVAALALTATLCTGAVAAVGGDDGRLRAEPFPHAGAAAKRNAAHERHRAPRRSDKLRWPLHGAITGRFGEPRPGHYHQGIDIPMPAGTPIRAAGSGIVVLREWQEGYGRYTCIAHRRITTCYGHQSRFGTTLGARVRRGQVIGYVGSTGDTSVNHLHFEVRRGTRPWGTPMNPVKRLPTSP